MVSVPGSKYLADACVDVSVGLRAIWYVLLGLSRSLLIFPIWKEDVGELYEEEDE